MDRRCPECGEPCVPSAATEHTAAAGSYRVTFKGIPFLSCPRGCVVDQPDLAGSLLPLLKLASQLSHAVAKKKGLFRKRDVCRECGDDLLKEPTEGRWGFRPDPSSPLEVTITGPGHLCPRCQKSYIPRPVDIQSFSDSLTGGRAP
jgi:hypothetical protein